MSKQPDVSWTKADKPFPKKSATLSSFLNSFNGKDDIGNSHAMETMQQREFHCQNSSLNDDRSKFRFKDLCIEDKLRMANLIKELAKIAEEKKLVEQKLEEEREQKERQMKEILQQQELLLNEKELLLNKYLKTQNKLTDLKERLKTERARAKLPPKPTICKKPITNENKDAIATEVKKTHNDPFNPFKSSTPKNLSPRSLSPISMDSLNRNMHEMKSSPRDQNEHEDERKVELIKQQLDLVQEQKNLKELLEQQEKILKEKQEQIILQQKIHRERLEQLARIKLDNEMESQKRFIPEQYIVTQPANTFPTMMTPYHYVPNQIPLRVNPYPITVNNELPPQGNAIHPNDRSNENQSNDVEIIKQREDVDKIASLVYKKLLEKRQKSSSKDSPKSTEKLTANLRKTDDTSKWEDEDNLIDLIIKEKHLLNKKLDEKNSSRFMDESKLTENNSSAVFSNEDDDSKLIEDLFFLK